MVKTNLFMCIGRCVAHVPRQKFHRMQHGATELVAGQTAFYLQDACRASRCNDRGFRTDDVADLAIQDAAGYLPVCYAVGAAGTAATVCFAKFFKNASCPFDEIPGLGFDSKSADEMARVVVGDHPRACA